MTSNNFNEYYHVSSGTKRRERTNLSRRDFLGALSAIGAGAFFSGPPMAAWAAAKPGRIDIHHHFQPDIYYAFQRAHNVGFDTNQWSLAKDLEDMDKAGTAIA